MSSERHDAIQDVELIIRLAAYGLRRLEGEAAHEDSQAPEEPLLSRGKEIVAPGDGIAHRLLSRWEIPAATGQERQTPLQTIEECRGREHLDASGSELDGQRQPVQPAADRMNRLDILVRQGEIEA